MASPDPRAVIAGRHRFRPIEALPWLLAVAAFFLLPDYAYLGTQVMILILFALSLDLILGYAGIVTLGHAAYFGLGAYTAGMLSAHLGWHEPLTGLLRRGCRGRAVRLPLGPDPAALSRPRAADADACGGVHAAGDRERAGVADRRLRWPLRHHAGAACSAVSRTISTATPTIGMPSRVLFLSFLLCRRIVHSPFGLSLKGLRENERRMRAIGCDVLRPQGRDLHGLDRPRRARGRPVRAGQRLRLARRVQLRPLGHRPDRAGARRQRPALWRDPRRRRAVSAGGPSRAAQPRVLAVRHRARAGAGGAVLARRPARPARSRRSPAGAACGRRVRP